MIVEAIAAGDSDGARAALRMHLGGSRDRLAARGSAPDSLSIDRENMPDFLVRLRDGLRFSHGFAGRSGDVRGLARRRTRAAARRGRTGARRRGDGRGGQPARGRRRAAPPSPRGLPDRRRDRGADAAAARGRAASGGAAAARPRVGVRDRQGEGHHALGRPGRARREAAAWQARLYDGVSLGEALVARGFAVLAADALGWGSRQGNGYAAQQALAANLMQFGLTLAGVIAAEDAQLVRWLARHPAVDARRVGGARLLLRRLPRLAGGGALPGGGRRGGGGLDGAARRPDAAGRQPAARPVRLLRCCIRRWAAASTIPTSPGSRRRGRCCSSPDPRPALSAALGRGGVRRPARIWRAAGDERALETSVFEGDHVFPAEQQARAWGFLDEALHL